MPKGKKIKVPLRRRREGRTDYRQRLKLLKSGKTRFVVRRFSGSFTCQVIQHVQTGDKTLVTANVSDLKKTGWKGHTGNIPAAYLIGYICGKKAMKAKVTDAVLDLGLHTSTKGSSLYAALRGAIDGGLKIPCSKDILPPEERLAGKHIADYASKLKKENPEKYKSLFSAYLKAGLEPEKLPEYFLAAKKAVKI